jgi:hypothetical protein
VSAQSLSFAILALTLFKNASLVPWFRLTAADAFGQQIAVPEGVIQRASRQQPQRVTHDFALGSVITGLNQGIDKFTQLITNPSLYGP